MLERGGLWDKSDKICYVVDDHTSLFLRILQDFDEEDVARAMTIAWSLWRHRNSVMWEGKESTTVHNVFSAI